MSKWNMAEVGKAMAILMGIQTRFREQCEMGPGEFNTEILEWLSKRPHEGGAPDKLYSDIVGNIVNAFCADRSAKANELRRSEGLLSLISPPEGIQLPDGMIVHVFEAKKDCQSQVIMKRFISHPAETICLTEEQISSLINTCHEYFVGKWWLLYHFVKCQNGFCVNEVSARCGPQNDPPGFNHYPTDCNWAIVAGSRIVVPKFV